MTAAPCPSWCHEHDGNRPGALWHESDTNRGPEGVGLRIHWRVSAFQPDDGPLQPPRVTLFGTDGVMLYDDLPVDAFAGLVEQLTTTLAEVRS